MILEWSSDGCPNDCGYCRSIDMPCIYTEQGKVRNNVCAKCGKKLADDETYSYRGFDFCEDCLDEGRMLVEKQRTELIHADFHTDMRYSNPTRFNQLQENYENGILTKKG